MSYLPSIEHLVALRARLQTVEDGLVAAGRRNVTIPCAAGLFAWVRRGAGRAPSEELRLDDIEEAADMIVSQGPNYVVPMTEHGTFTWLPRTRSRRNAAPAASGQTARPQRHEKTQPSRSDRALNRKGGKRMSDDKSKVGAQDRSRIAAGEPYEVEYFARKHGLTQAQAREIIEKHGPDREACDRAANRQHA